MTRYLYSRGPIEQVFSQRANDELDWSYEKNVGQFRYFSNDEESAWLENIDPSLLDKSNEEEQYIRYRRHWNSDSVPLPILLPRIPRK